MGGGGTTVEGRIVVRFHPLATGDPRGAYGLDFGFLTEAMRTSRSSLSAAIEANPAVLPASRTLTAAKLRQRAQQRNRNWLFSSTIRIPITGAGASLEGRVLVRVNPGRNNAFSIEFGFLPEAQSGISPGDSARQISAKVQNAARNHALLPRSRFLSSSGIAERVAAARQASSRPWVHSSVIAVPLGDDPPPPPLTVSVTCPTDEVSAGARVTCRADASGGTLPYTYSWSAPAAIQPMSVGSSWSAQFSSPGAHRVQVTVTDSARRRANGGASVRVPPPLGPTVRVTCPTDEVSAGAQVTCQAAASGGSPPYSYSWSAPAAIPPVGVGPSWSGQFSSPGAHRVQVTVTDNARQMGTGEASVRVIPPDDPLTVEASCTPEEVRARGTVTCWATASGGTPPYTYSWSAQGASPPSGSDLVWNTQLASGGTYTVQVTVTDSAGQRAEDPTPPRVTVTEPLTVEATCSPEQVDPGDTVICWATVSDGTPPYTFSWSAQGASSPSGSDLVWNTQFANGGTYTVQVNRHRQRRPAS